MHISIFHLLLNYLIFHDTQNKNTVLDETKSQQNYSKLCQGMIMLPLRPFDHECKGSPAVVCDLIPQHSHPSILWNCLKWSRKLTTLKPHNHNTNFLATLFVVWRWNYNLQNKKGNSENHALFDNWNQNINTH